MAFLFKVRGTNPVASKAELRSEEQLSALGLVPIQRLDSQSVAHQHQAPRCARPPRQGEHAVEAPQRAFQPPMAKGGQHHLCVP